MSLEQKRIIANTKKYFDTAKTHGFMTDELMTFLGEDFIKAPASNLKSQNNAFEGGLIEHLLRVAFYAVRLNNSLPEDEQVSLASLLKVCLLHQIGKAKLFIPCESEWHRVNQGKMYDYNEDLVSMKVSDRSIMYCMANGVSLSEEEYQAIIMFDRDDKMSEYHNSTLGELLKFGNIFAIKHSKRHG